MDTEELLPATRRALLHRIAVAQSVGRTPSLLATVVRDGAGRVTHLDLGTFVFTREPYPADGAVPGSVPGPVPGGVDPGGWIGL